MLKVKSEVKVEEKYAYGLMLIYKLVRNVFPDVGSQLKYWGEICNNIEDDFLRNEALSSIQSNKFHAQGGSVFALYPGTDIKKSTRLIVSLQTIGDYLDSLCSRTEMKNEAALRQLHLAMLDSIDPFSSVDSDCDINNYYCYYPHKNDGNYLNLLVETCKTQIRSLPSYYLVFDCINKFIQLYSDVQIYKHLEKNIREKDLKNWAEYYSTQYPEISCWEFSAAAGSTLGVFILFAAAFNSDMTVEEVQAIEAAYFPWICGLHKLLEHYIDAHEDTQIGALNFTHYYNSLKQCEERISFFLEQSLRCCINLRYPEFHIAVIKGLISMYLSDPKAFVGMNKLASMNILYGNKQKNKPGTVLYFKLWRILRAAGAI